MRQAPGEQGYACLDRDLAHPLSQNEGDQEIACVPAPCLSLFPFLVPSQIPSARVLVLKDLGLHTFLSRDVPPAVHVLVEA